MKEISRIGYAVLAVFVSAILIGAGVVWYVTYEIDKNNQVICDVLEIVYQPTPETPVPDPNDPKQQRAADVRSKIGKAIHTYDCR